MSGRFVFAVCPIALCLASSALAQVSVDMHALDQPGMSQPPAREAPHHPAATPKPDATAGSAVRRPASASKAAAAGGSPHRTPPPSAAGTPAPNAPVTDASGAKAPIPALPTVQPSGPPASTTVPATAPDTAPLPPPVRLVFESGQTELTPDDEASIKDLARAMPTPAIESINVLAYAAGKPDDPSTARRVSLTRGMAVRSVLLASGVPSAQIYVRALGATPSDGPADRVELIVAPIGTLTR